jgi:hypothetical protein
MRFNKDFNAKTIVVMISILLLFNNTAYSSSLRVPLKIEKGRQSKALQLFNSASDKVANDSQEGSSRNLVVFISGINDSYDASEPPSPYQLLQSSYSQSLIVIDEGTKKVVYSMPLEAYTKELDGFGVIRYTYKAGIIKHRYLLIEQENSFGIVFKRNFLVQRGFAPMTLRNAPVRRITSLLPLEGVPAPLQTPPAVVGKYFILSYDCE